MNGAHQLVVCVDDVNLLGGSEHTVKENALILIVASKEIGIEVNGDKTKYMFMSRDKNAERSHSVKIDSILFEMVEEFKCLEKKFQQFKIMFRNKSLTD